MPPATPPPKPSLLGVGCRAASADLQMQPAANTAQACSILPSNLGELECTNAGLHVMHHDVDLCAAYRRTAKPAVRGQCFDVANAALRGSPAAYAPKQSTAPSTHAPHGLASAHAHTQRCCCVHWSLVPPLTQLATQQTNDQGCVAYYGHWHTLPTAS